jgi:hypothetical protein
MVMLIAIKRKAPISSGRKIHFSIHISIDVGCFVIIGGIGKCLTSEFTGLRGFSRRSGGMMGWARH